MKSKTASIVLIVGVALIAIILSLVLFSQRDDIVLEVDDHKREEHSNLEPLEIITPYEQQTLTGLTVSNTHDTLYFKPNAKRRWQLVSPVLNSFDAPLMKESLYKLTNIQGRPLDEIGIQELLALHSSKDELRQETVDDLFSDPMYKLTYYNQDGGDRTLEFVDLALERDILYVRLSGGEHVWQVKNLSDTLSMASYNYLNRKLLPYCMGDISEVRMWRKEDGLSIAASRSEEAEDEAAQEQQVLTSRLSAEECNRESEADKIETLLTTKNGKGKQQLEESPVALSSRKLSDEEQPVPITHPSFTLNWNIHEPVIMTANLYNFNALIQEFLDLEARVYVASGGTDLGIYGLDDPALSFVISGERDGEVFSEKITLGQEERGVLYGYSSYQDAVFMCGSGSIRMSEIPFMDLIDRYPLRKPLNVLGEIEVTTPNDHCIIEYQPDEKDDALLGKYTYNGNDAPWLSADHQFYLRTFYRSLAQIQAAGLDIDLPETLSAESYSIKIMDMDEQSYNLISLIRRDEDSFYLFMNDSYTGLYCNADVLFRNEKDNYGMLLELEKIEAEAQQYRQTGGGVE